MKNTPKKLARKIGVEIEYAGIDVETTSSIIQQLYGGTINPTTNVEIKVSETSLGNFSVEVDARLIKEIERYKAQLEPESKSDNTFTRLHASITKLLSHQVVETSANLVPYEIVCPPITTNKLSELDKLIHALRKDGAKGTTANPLYAFGLHLNPEVTSTEVGYVLRHLQSYLLLEKWLFNAHDVNTTRRITPFIDPFPNDYKAILLRHDYQPRVEGFFKDYSTFNATRNRALDLLPLLEHINSSLYRKYFDSTIKNNPRPTFHYRLPNCEIDKPNWTITHEYQTWLTVERLAENQELLKQTISQWNRQQQDIKLGRDNWVDEMSRIVENQL